MKSSKRKKIDEIEEKENQVLEKENGLFAPAEATEEVSLQKVNGNNSVTNQNNESWGFNFSDAKEEVFTNNKIIPEKKQNFEFEIVQEENDTDFLDFLKKKDEEPKIETNPKKSHNNLVNELEKFNPNEEDIDYEDIGNMPGLIL